MHPDVPSLIASIEKQAHLFRELEKALLASRSAYVSRDLDQIYIQLNRQTLLCGELQSAKSQNARRLSPAAAHSESDACDLPGRIALKNLSPEVAQRVRQGFVELAIAEHSVRRLNAQQQAFVAGSLRTLRAMNNAFSNLYHTYDGLVPFLPAPPMDGQS